MRIAENLSIPYIDGMSPFDPAPEGRTRLGVSDAAFRWAVLFLAAAAGFTVLWAAQAVFAPLVLAIVIGVVLSPVTTFGHRIGLPPVLNALTVLFLTIGGLSLLVALLEPPVERILERAPSIWFEIQQLVAELQQRLTALARFSDEVSRTLGEDPAAAASSPIPSWSDALLFAPSLAAQILIFMGGLFFFLLSRDQVYIAVANVVPTLTRSRILNVERRVSHYFLTISVINICFGALVALALHLVGMPSALLWGVVAAALNFILYLGPLLVAVSIAVTSLLVFDGPAVLLPPILYIALNLTEGQFVTPALVGRQMSVNPLLVFVSLVFWLWLWGPVGGFVAIPVLLIALGLWDQARRPDVGAPGALPDPEARPSRLTAV